MERYYRPICGFLFKRLRQPDLVDDLAQETFLEAYRALKTKYDPQRAFPELYEKCVLRR